MFQAVRNPIPATTLRSARSGPRWARRVSIAGAVILAVGPLLIYLYWQWSDVYVYRPEPIISLLIGLGVVLVIGLGVGLSLRFLDWRGYAVDFIRCAVVGCVGACAAIFIAMLLAI